MISDLNAFVRTYAASLDTDRCEEIIRRFEQDASHHQSVALTGHRSFTELNISTQSEWTDIHDLIVNTTIDALPQYCRDIGLDARQFPEHYGFEQVRIKRYHPHTEDEFRLHVDVGDQSSARRFLVCLWYLNTVPMGGETVFPRFLSDGSARVIPPVQGQLLMFPPLWMFLHAGNKTISQPKYIIGTYLHYLP